LLPVTLHLRAASSAWERPSQVDRSSQFEPRCRAPIRAGVA